MYVTDMILPVPLFQITEKFLSENECRELIDIARPNLKHSTVINGSHGSQEVNDYRTSDNYDLPTDHVLTKTIYDRISNLLDIDQSRFEKIEIIRYKVGELFDNHIDYFQSNTDKKHFKHGGQRVATVLMYLNDDAEGGETFFPRLRIIETPKTGKMIYFKYDYSDEINIKTTHKGMPVISGEKWVATVWIRQTSRTQLHDEIVLDNIGMINDSEYQLECCVQNDIRPFTVKLPGNIISENTIIVEVTPELSSELLLYIISALNSYQQIPYHILPIIVGYYSSLDINLMNSMISRVKNKTSSDYIISSEIYDKNQTLIEIFNNKTKDRFYKFCCLFGSNFNKSDISDIFVNPFSNLTQSHITWAMKKLDMMD